jgi:hypothetical protein
MTKAPRTRTRARPVSSGSDGGQGQTTPQTASIADGSDDYEVGYKKPPSRTRFRPGQSGNPKGRPKGSRNLKTELEEELQERIAVREGGARRTISKQRAMLKGLTAKAVQGDPRTANLLLNLVLRLLSQDEDDQPVQPDECDLMILQNFKARALRHALSNKEKKDD